MSRGIRREEEEKKGGGMQFELRGDLSSFPGLTENKVIRYERQKQRLLSSLSQLVTAISPPPAGERWLIVFFQGSPCDSSPDRPSQTCWREAEGNVPQWPEGMRLLG